MLTNNQIMYTDIAGPNSRALVERWSMLHAGRCRDAHSLMGVDGLALIELCHSRSGGLGGFRELVSQPSESRSRSHRCAGVFRLVPDGAAIEHLPKQSEIVPRLDHSGELRYGA